MRKLHKLKLRRYADRIIKLTGYLDAFKGEKSSDKSVDTELNGIILNSIINVCSKQSYVQGFDSKYTT